MGLRLVEWNEWEGWMGRLNGKVGREGMVYRF